MTQTLDLHFAGRRALVLHPAATVRAQLAARLSALGVETDESWPADEPDLARADILFADVDTGHDEQFPWRRGQAPIPTVGLIQSEAPGRLAWALQQGFDAFQPLAALGKVYSTLVIATARAAERQQRMMRDAEVARRTGLRHVLVQATLKMMRREGLDEMAALKRLRALAMAERVALEDAAAIYLAEAEPRAAGGRE